MDIQQALEKLQDFDVNDIDWDRIGTWPLAGRVAVWAITVIALIAGGYFLKVKDLNMSHDRLAKEELTLRETFRTKSFQAKNLEAYRLQAEEMEESFGALLKQLPKDTEVPGLLEDITDKGTDSGLNLSTIELQPEIVAEFYVELPIKIAVEGTYHDFGGFVSGVAGLPRIVTLHDYEIKKADGGLLQMNINAKTYRYKTQEEE